MSSNKFSDFWEALIKDKGLEVLVFARRYQAITQHQSYVDAMKVLEELIKLVRESKSA
jgi:hypothetical protein